MLINKAHVRKFTLECAEKRAHKFTRVSQEFLDNVEFRLRDIIRKKIEMVPSKGRTIK